MTLEHALALLLVGIFGAAIGSWLNVVILRLHADQPWWRGRSSCPHCGTVLQWYELVPVISYVWLGGRCRHCHQALTKQYVIVEVLSALTFMIIWTQLPLGFGLVLGWTVAATMIIIGVYDGRWAMIPDSFSIPFIVASAALSWWRQVPLLDVFWGALAGGLFFAVQHVVSKRRWIGSGDIFLGVGLGLLLGWRFLFLALFLAYISGSIVAAGLILAKRLKLSSAMPFGPYLMAAGFVTWLWGPKIVDWYFRHALFF